MMSIEGRQRERFEKVPRGASESSRSLAGVSARALSAATSYIPMLHCLARIRKVTTDTVRYLHAGRLNACRRGQVQKTRCASLAMNVDFCQRVRERVFLLEI